MQWMIIPHTNIVSNEKFFLVPVEKNIALINEVVTTNRTGAFMLRLLEQPASFDFLLKKLIQEYNVDFETAKSDLENFLNLCLEKKVIKIIQKDLYIRITDG